MIAAAVLLCGHVQLTCINRPTITNYCCRIVGRWEVEDGRVVAVWEYDDRAAYERIDAAVRSDPAVGIAAQRRSELPPLIEATEEVFMTSTVQLS
jgi:hypothetical protein